MGLNQCAIRQVPIQKEESEEEIQLSCCGDEMTGILEDIQICPTCKEHQ